MNISFVVSGIFKTMIYYRVDFTHQRPKRIPFINKFLKWVIVAYIIPASIYLCYKLYFLLQSDKPIWYEWIAVIFNLLLIIILTRQLLKLNKVKYIIITDDYLKYGQHFPWDSRISWRRVRQIRYGYSNVRFITKGGEKYRFSLSKINKEEQSKFFETLDLIAKKYEVDLQLPANNY